MASEMGISEATVRRIWHANGLKPHLVKSFKISKDNRFAEKMEDLVGLYLNPPEHAIVLCVDEKIQNQVLAPVRNDRRIGGKTHAPTAGFVVSRHDHYVVGAAGVVRSRRRAFSRYKVATLPTPSASTGAMKAAAVW